MSVYSPLDYLLFRLYEAGKQLNGFGGQKIAVVILEDYEDFFQTPLEQSWIDWSKPHFFEADDDITPFLHRERRENPHLDDDVRYHISRLDEVWIFKPMNWLLSRKHVIRLKRHDVG
jgi:hypothetical protein